MAKQFFKGIILLAACTSANVVFADFYAGGQTGSVTWDDNNTAVSFDVYGGYQFSEFLAAEIAYTDLGSFDDNNAGDTFTTSVAGASYSLVGLLPLDDTFTLKGKVSYFDYSIDRERNGKASSKAEAGNVTYSAGIDMNIADNINVSLEYRFIPLEFNLYSNVDSAPKQEISHNQTESADNLSLGLNIAF